MIKNKKNKNKKIISDQNKLVQSIRYWDRLSNSTIYPKSKNTKTNLIKKNRLIRKNSALFSIFEKYIKIKYKKIQKNTILV